MKNRNEIFILHTIIFSIIDPLNNLRKRTRMYVYSEYNIQDVVII